MSHSSICKVKGLEEDDEERPQTVTGEGCLVNGAPIVRRPLPAEDDNEASSLDRQIYSRQRARLHSGIGFRSYLDNYVLLLTTSSFLEAMNSTCFKVVTRRISVFQLAMIRGFVSVCILAVMCCRYSISPVEPRSKVPWYFARGIIGASAFMCVFFTVYKLPLSEAAFLTNSYPAVTAAVSWLLGMEQLGLLTWLGIFGCFVGNGLVARPPFLFGGQEDWSSDRLVGIGTAAGANLFLAMTFLIIRHIGKDISNLVLTAYMQSFCCLLSIPFVVNGYPVQFSTQMSPLEWFCLVASCATSVPSQVALSRGMQIGPPSKTTSLFMTNILISAFMGAFALREHLAWISVIGAGIVLSSVILITTQSTTKSESSYERLQENDGEPEAPLLEDA